MGEQFKSGLVDELKSNDYVITKDGVTVHLAKDFGFCWGVERSIALAYEAVEHFPNKKVHITNELIHNPEVNDRLHDMNVQFIEKVNDSTKDFSTVGDGDVVILPAFGASFEEMSLLHSKNVDIVDTTCPWVSKVWNTVDKHQKEGLTSIIHGKYAHEETVATVSFCEEYICVKDMKEAEMVADYIVNGGDKTQFLTYFEKAVSKGFDPDTMLRKVGLANQTTMYKKETRAIGQMMQKAMMKKYGPVDAKDHYQEFDTICDATQVRVSGMGRGNINDLSHLDSPLSIVVFAFLLCNRSDKMRYMISSRRPMNSILPSSLLWVGGIHPIRPIYLKSLKRRESDHSISIRLNVSVQIIPLHIGP